MYRRPCDSRHNHQSQRGQPRCQADDEQRRQNQFRPHGQIPVDRIRQQIERKGKLTVYFCKPVFPVPFFQARFKKFIRGKKPERQQTEGSLPRGVG